MRYFSSDLHINHSNIIKYCNRPCTVETHKEWLYSQFKHLKQGDHLGLLGDLIFKAKLADMVEFFGLIHDQGAGLDIAIGNHDEPFFNMMLEAYRKVFGLSGHDHIKHYFVERFSGEETPFKKMVMCHYPMESWDGSYHGSVMLHGHSHGMSQPFRHRYDMGIDVEHKVYSLDDIVAKYLADANTSPENRSAAM